MLAAAAPPSASPSASASSASVLRPPPPPLLAKREKEKEEDQAETVWTGRKRTRKKHILGEGRGELFWDNAIISQYECWSPKTTSMYQKHTDIWEPYLIVLFKKWPNEAPNMKG